MTAFFKRFENVSKTSWKHVNKNRLSQWYVLNRSLRHLCKTSWRSFEDVLKRLSKTSSRCLQDVLKNVFARRLEDVWPRAIYWSWSRRLEDVLKTSSEDAWVRWIYSFWWWRLEDVFWRRRQKTSSSRLMFSGFFLRTVFRVIFIAFQ